MRRLAALLLIAVGTSCSTGAQRSGPTTTSIDAPATSPADGCAPRPDLVDEPYVEGAEALQTLDLHQPEGAGCDPVPLVVWVHGGGWQIGDKANRMDDKVELWNGAGWAVASIDYRLTDPDEPAATRVVAPMHDEDVASAVGWLIRNSDDLGVDPGRVALLGHSAGAGIAAALASDPRYLGAEGLEPTSLSCVAPLDTEGFDVAAVIEEGGASARLYRTVFGDDEARWRDLSPIEHLGEGAVPDLFLVTRGSADRRAKVAAFAAAATGSGAAVTVVDLPSFSHGDVNVRIGADGDDVLTPALQAFLSGCLGGGEDAQAVP